MSTKKVAQQKKSKQEERLPYAYEALDIAVAIKTCREIIGMNIFRFDMNRVVRKALFTELIINLNDLLQKASDAGARVNFRNEIDPALDLDVTDLINKIRICSCHLSTPQSLHQGGKSLFNLHYNNASNEMLTGQNGDVPVTDVSVNFGVYFVHYEHHILPAFKAAEHFFMEVQKDPFILRILDSHVDLA